MSRMSSSNWSETAASNNAASPNGAPEGTPASTINDIMREMMSALKIWWNTSNAILTTGGAANAYTLTPATALAAYVDGEVFCFELNHSNTGSATLNISGLGAVTFKKITTSGYANVASGELQSGARVIVAYNSTGPAFSILSMLPPSSTVVDVASPVQGDVIYHNGTTWVRLAAGTSGQYLRTAGAAANPSWSLGAVITTLTDAATVAVDFANGSQFTVTLGGNRTLGAPSNVTVGQSGVIEIVQDGTGSRTLAYHANWKFPNGTDPTLSTAAGAVDLLAWWAKSSTVIYASLTKAYS